MLSTKKASTQIWWILASAIIAVILIFWIVPFIQRAIEPLSASFDELGDCDKDHVNNFRDQCPCLSTKGIESEKLPGCPITATKEISEKDKAECKMFKSKDDETKYVEKCDQEDKSKCIIKCNQVQQDATEVPESAGKGVAGNWDVTFGTIKYYHKSAEQVVKNDRLDIDADGDNSITLEIEPIIKNIRSQAVGKDFAVSVEVCDNNKQSCTPAKMTGTDKGSKAWVVNSIEGDNKEKTLPRKVFLIGQGDYCDGEGETGCYLKITADAAFDLAEQDEFNNEEAVFVSLKNKDFLNYEFKKFQIKAVAGDGSNGGSIDKSYNMFVYRTLESIKLDNDDNKNIPTDYPAAGNCWVIGERHNTILSNDYGTIILLQGHIINNLIPKKLTPIVGNPVGHKDGIQPLQEFSWKADSKGSLICKENNWLLCDSAAADKVVEINNKKFRCTSNQQWE